jgi:hypothetical protein
MSPEQPNFKDLRRLLALKRHEQPPPGYFHDFSHQVIARIQAGETAAALGPIERVLARWPWLRGVWGGFEAKPLVAGAFGVAVCGLLVVGLVSSERSDAGPRNFAGQPSSPETVFATVQKQNVGSLFERAAADHSLTGQVYTTQNRSSIFDEIQRPHVQAVSFH